MWQLFWGHALDRASAPESESLGDHSIKEVETQQGFFVGHVPLGKSCLPPWLCPVPACFRPPFPYGLVYMWPCRACVGATGPTGHLCVFRCVAGCSLYVHTLLCSPGGPGSHACVPSTCGVSGWQPEPTPPALATPGSLTPIPRLLRPHPGPRRRWSEAAAAEPRMVPSARRPQPHARWAPPSRPAAAVFLPN